MRRRKPPHLFWARDQGAEPISGMARFDQLSPVTLSTVDPYATHLFAGACWLVGVIGRGVIVICSVLDEEFYKATCRIAIGGTVRVV
jgi:hypothetical protein